MYETLTGTQRVDMEVVGTSEVKMFCKDYVEHATVMFILSTIACFVVIISLVHFLVSLSLNLFSSSSLMLGQSAYESLPYPKILD
jgi:hypothetical protein